MRGRSFARRQRADRERVDFLHQQLFQRLVHQPLPRHPVRADERGRHQLHRKMALARGIMPGMAAMLLTVVDDEQMRRIERQTQARLNFCGDRAFRLAIHPPYIGVLHLPG